MPLPTITAVNQTASPVLLTRLGLTVPASGSLVLSDYAWRHEILTDESLYAAIGNDEILLALGVDTLTKGESLKFFGIVSQEVRMQVRLLSDTNVASLSGAGGTIDGQTTVVGDRVLLTAQSTPSQNGVWVVQSGAWVRPDDFAVGTSAAGALITIGPDGTSYANQMWQSNADQGSDTVGTSNLTFTQAAGGSTTLQEAYEAGNTITTSAGEGNLTFTGTEDFLVTLADVDFDVTGTLTLDATGAITIGGDADTGAINIGTGAAARVLTLGNGTGATAVNVDTGTGGFDVDSLGVVSIGSADTTDLTMSANSGVNKTLTIAATNAGAGDGLISITADGAVSVSSTTSTIDLQAAGNVTIDSSGGTIGIGTDANTGAINIGTAASARQITIGNTTTGTDVLITAATTGGEITLTAPLTRITGDLVVEGTTTTVESQTVLLADNHIYINAGYTTAAAQTGGLVVNYLPIATTDTVAAGGFTAGVPATSNPTVATTAAATFAVGQFIQISNTNNPENEGLFEVLSHAANVLTIRGIGTTATVEDFTQNQFTTDATAGGTITRVNISVMRAGSDGVWEFGSGSTTPITFYDVINTNTLTLQNAYVGGNTINVTSGEGPLAITLTSDDFTVNGANDVDFGGSTALSSFNLDTTGAITVDGAGVSIDGTAASNFSVTGANLTISTITSGNLSLTSAGTWTATGTTMDMDATGVLSLNSSGGAINIGNDANAFAINIGTGAAARTVTVGNGTGATAVLVQTGTEGFQINSLGTGIMTDYGKSATDPTARAGGFQNGDRYYNTSLLMEMTYDSTRSKWLSKDSHTFFFGRNGVNADGTYYRGPDGLVMSATRGWYAPHNGTIVGIGYTRDDTDSATFDVVEGGVSRATLASTALAGGTNASNGDFTAGGILAVLNQAGGNATSNVTGWFKVRFRV